MEGKTDDSDRGKIRERESPRRGLKGAGAREGVGRGTEKATERPVRFWFDAVRFGS